MSAPSRVFYGWYLLATTWALIFINCGFPFYGGGVLNPAMSQALHLDKKTLGLGFSVMSLTSSLSAPVVGIIIKRAGVRVAFIIGSLSLAIGAALLGTVVTMGWQYVLTFGLLVGIGPGIGAVIAAQSAMARWFQARRGIAIAIAMTATAIGGFVIPTVMTHVIGASGEHWRTGWLIVAGFALLAAVLSRLFVKNAPEEIGEVPDGHAWQANRPATTVKREIHRSTRNWTIPDALRTPTFWCFSLAALCATASFFTYVAHGIVHLRTVGYDAAFGAKALSIMALSSLVGRMGAGVLCDRVEPRYVWATALALTAIAIFLFAGSPSRNTVYAFAILFGISYGANLIASAATLANFYGAISYPTIVGTQALLISPLSALTPVAAGILFERQGSYTTAFLALAAMVAVAGLWLFIVRPPRDREPLATAELQEAPAAS